MDFQEDRKPFLRNSLHFVYYNFAKIHKSLRVTPAMEAKLTPKPMTIEDIVNLTETYKQNGLANSGLFYYLYFKMKFLECLVELLNWCIIFICPVIIFGVTGFVLYHNLQRGIGQLFFVPLSCIGIAIGIYFAERIRKTVGCTNFITKKTPWNNSK